MKLKKIMIGVCLSTLLGFTLTACDSSANKTDNSTKSSDSSTEKTDKKEKVDINSLDLPQLNTEVAENEALVEMTTSMGKVKIKLFPELAPKAVENFITHAKNGYYNGTTFHRVINEFMIQGGDPAGDGTGGESIWKKPFGLEISNQLYHIRGALAMARSQEEVSQGSQFYIVQNNQDMSDGLLAEDVPEKIIEAYENGGYPALDGQYTVFGQVVEGMDVVDTIARVETDPSNDKPKTDVTIEKIDVLQEAK